MASDHDISIRHVQLLQFDPIVGGGEDKAVDLIDPAVDNAKLPATELEAYRAR